MIRADISHCNQCDTNSAEIATVIVRFSILAECTGSCRNGEQVRVVTMHGLMSQHLHHTTSACFLFRHIAHARMRSFVSFRFTRSSISRVTTRRPWEKLNALECDQNL